MFVCLCVCLFVWSGRFGCLEWSVCLVDRMVGWIVGWMVDWLLLFVWFCGGGGGGGVVFGLFVVVDVVWEGVWSCVCVIVVTDRFYIALFSAIRQTHCAHM